MTLAEFLLARITEDEAACEGIYSGSHDATFQWGPDRIRAECEAKRRTIALAEGTGPYAGEQFRMYDAAAEILRALAAPYSDHPDYRKEWAL